MSTLKTNQLSNLAEDFVIDVKEVQPVPEAYTSLGAYGAGLVFNSYTDTFTYTGAEYRPLTTLALPYITTGVGAGEIASFRSVGDAVLTSDLAAVGGAELVGLSRINGLADRTVQDFALETVSINDFFIPGQVDWTVALQAARDYLFNFVGKPPALEFVGGEVYEASTMPNWNIKNLIIRGNGATWRNTGTGDNLIIDSGASSGLTFHVDVSSLFLEGGPSTGHGVFCRSVHHSSIQAEVRGCGTAKNALQVNFAVVTEFKVVASVNRGAWYLGGQPQRGIVLDARVGLEAVTACTFVNPIIEGVSTQGILLTNADTCTFIGGTSEANAGANVECSFESRFNNFYGIDLEMSGTGQGFIDRGRQNSWHNIYNDALCTITATAVGCRILGGVVDAISNSSASTDLDGVRYGIASGVISNIGGVLPRKRSVYSIVTATFDVDELKDFKINGGATIKRHLSVSTVSGAWSVPASVPGIAKKDGIAMPGVVLGDTITIGSQTVVPEGYTLSAVVLSAGTVSLRAYQLYGAAASPYPAGGTFRLDAWGH